MSFGASQPPRKPQRRIDIPLRQRPGIIIPPPIDPASRLPPIRLAPLTDFHPTETPLLTSLAPSHPFQKQYPKTPTSHWPAPIPSVVARLMKHPPFRVVKQEPINIFTINKSGSAGPEFRDLQTLLCVVCSKGARTALTQNDYSQLMDLICEYIFRWPPPLPVRNAFAESQPVYEVTNFAHLQVAHLILQSLLVEPAAIVNFITPRFIADLIAHLDTPVVQEQGHIEFEIQNIVENFPHLVPVAVNSLVHSLIAYGSGLRSSACVAPVLRILHSYFQKNVFGLASHVYRHVIVPLYFTNFLIDFEKPLRMITSFFVGQDARNAEYCLQQLLRHWPLTNARKEVSFLQQLTLLLGKCSDSVLPGICKRVLKVMARCLVSANASVAVTACFLLLDGQFLCAFGVVRATFRLVLVPALRLARGHWHGDAGKMVRELLDVLGDDDTIESDAARLDAEARAVWGDLARKARVRLYTA
jgi:hypothetical protein